MQAVKTIVIDDTLIEIDTFMCDDGAIYYDLFVEGQCINEGTVFWEIPTVKEIKQQLQNMERLL